MQTDKIRCKMCCLHFASVSDFIKEERKITMERISEILAEICENYPKELAKELKKLSNKLLSYAYCPCSEKEYARMEPFAQNAELAEIVFNILKECTPESLKATYELRDYWYCIALISHWGDDEAVKYLSDTTDALIAAKSGDTDLMKRNFEHIKKPIYSEISQKLDDYFKKLYDECPVFDFIKEVGLTIPEDWAGFTIGFNLQNYEDFQSYNDLTDKERLSRYTLKVDFGTPYGDGEFFKLDFQDMKNHIRLHTNNIDNFTPRLIEGGTTLCEIETATDIMKLKETVAKIEEVLDIKLYHCEVFVPRGVKSKKILSDWIKKHIMSE